MADIIPATLAAFVLLNKGRGAHHQSGGAEAALNGSGFDIGFLYRGEFTVFYLALNGAYGFAFNPGAEGQAAVDGGAVDQHSTGAALSDTTTLLGTGQAVIAKNIQQRVTDIDMKLNVLSVQVEGNGLEHVVG